MAKPIGIWTAAELLADMVQPASSESREIKGESARSLAAFEFLRLAAAEGRCLVKGRRGQNGMWEPIAADLWISLTIDPIAAKSDDDAEYSEAQAYPKKSGPDYQKNLWNDLRWNRNEIEALRPSFMAWYDAGRPPELPVTRGGAVAQKVERQQQVPEGETPPVPPEEASEEMCAAEERSREMKRQDAAGLFAEPFWPASRVIAWIAFRDPTQIQANWRAAQMYTKIDSAHAPTPLKNHHPRMTLLRALQYDNLRAIKDGKELPREEWAAADGHKWPDVRFRREDALALWPDPRSDGAAHLSFKEIAYRWSKLTREPAEKMMDALVRAFWRGAFECGRESEVFNLLAPNGPVSIEGEMAGQYAYSSAYEGDAVTKIGDDGEHRLTIERRAVRIRRQDVAEVLGGSPYVPWVWDGTEDGLITYTGVPYAGWPLRMRRAHFEEWHICRADFSTWYEAAGIWPMPALESMWPHASVGAGAKERERLLAQARAARSLHPRARRNTVLGLVRDSLWSRACTANEIMEAACGDPQGRDYWEAWLFEPLSVHNFADLLVVHRAAAEGAPTSNLNGMTVPVLDGYQQQVFEALRVAATSGERWFTILGKPSINVQPPDSALSPIAARVGEGRTYALSPRAALEWLARNPNAGHLVASISDVAKHFQAAGENALKVPLGRASDVEIDAAITAVYDKAAAKHTKPPNIKELMSLVKAELRAIGRDATYRRIEDHAEAEPHRKRRRPIGRTVATDRLRQAK